VAQSQSLLSQFSDALCGLAAGARDFLAGVRTKDGRRPSGVLWKPNAIVVSEQALPDAMEYEVRVGDSVAVAQLAGRDEGTNVAVLKLDREIGGKLPSFTVPRTGALALALGTGLNGPSARLAIVRSVGDAWQSLAGGTIDHRIVLDTHIGATEEGGPVVAADGSLLGISTRGARRESLVIPASTVERTATALLEKGSVARGWLGVSLRPVAIPESLRPQGSQHVGLMVMEVVTEGPAAKAGVLAGDILISAGGVPATRPRIVAQQLGPTSIGKTVELSLARAGAIIRSEAIVEARRSG
jgi:S1-C subfamily serine protease